MEPSFSSTDFHSHCDRLAKRDPDLKTCLAQYGYPPMWTRKPSFETLIHIILEQQVSLASARSALQQLKKRIGLVTAAKLSKLSDADLKACYFSRQKIVYARHLAEAVTSGNLVIKDLAGFSNEEVRERLTAIKGIGNWTTDVYLMMVLHRKDLFPVGDLALMQSVRHVKKLPPHTTREEILAMSEEWKPYRTMAAFIFWHAYIKRKNITY
ncbi:MAG: DNA-3-methyladenine glycosylase 2 family protein [Bacteroidota bacterium]|nr:DNA-3-methyladenine glycosylase 2 family protein [Bacteroidota bacterium]